MTRKRKFKHAQRPYWTIRWRKRASFYMPPSQDRFKRFSKAMVEFIAWQEKRNEYQVGLFRVQPLVCGEPGWCSHNTEHVEHLMGDRYV